MKKITLVLSILTLCSAALLAQMPQGNTNYYGNEWIDYDQVYFKINLAKDGIYRLSYDELSDAGVFDAANNAAGAQLQLFYMGREVPLYVSTDAAFSRNDYIEFYGEKTDGWLDQFLYIQPSFQLNPDYSLFTDTASYFLTWREVASEERYANVSNNSSNPPPKELYCTEVKSFIFKERYSNGQGSSEAISCRYDLTEGYANNLSAQQSLEFATPKAYDAGNEVEIDLRLYTEGGEHSYAINLNNNHLQSDEFGGWQIKDYELSTNVNTLFTNTNNILDVSVQNPEDDETALVSVKIRYDRSFEFDNEDYVKFELQSTGMAQYLEIDGFNHGGQAPILYDLNNNVRILTSLESDRIKVVLPAANADRRCVLVAQNAIRGVAAIAKRALQEFDFDTGDHDYIILSHSKLYDDGNGANYVQQYADYRASAAGGSYNPIVVDVTQLYDQFGYGIDRHEVSIRNFLNLASTHWESEFLFILAKGMDKVKMRSNPAAWEEFSLVPPFGYPHSDYLFVMSNEDEIPWMGVGRIAAYTPQQVSLYLDKVKEFESVQANTPQTINDKAWMKRVLHFGGGDIDIQNFIRNQLNLIKDTISVGEYGADVVSFFKNSTDVIQAAPADEVEAYIENGASMLSFFGHSAPNTLDFNIDDPRVYQNKGKYPMFYAIGCNTNRVFDLKSTLSEDYVLIKDQGAIAFFGSTWVTQLGGLSRYASFLYGNLADEFYGEPIGTVIKETIKDFTIGNSFSQSLIKQALMLHGDPALKIYPHAAPDYLINVEKSNTFPEIVNLSADSFQLNFTITNIGKAVRDSINLRFEHLYPTNRKTFLQDVRLAAPPFESNHTVVLPLLEKQDAIGRNQIIVTVDTENEIAELPAAAEENNKGAISFFAIADDVKPVYPAEFGIVGDTDFSLQASTTNIFADPILYHLEIDSTIHFDSPIKRTTTIEQRGGVIDWRPNIDWQENNVYYWRISVDSTTTNGKGFIWNNSSFTYLPSHDEGWNQAHYYQYLSDELRTLKMDSTTRRWNFGELVKNVRIRSSAFKNDVEPGGLGWIEVALFENGFRQFSGFPCPSPHRRLEQIMMADYNPVSLERDNFLPPLHETPNCKNKDINWYIFQPYNTAERAKFIETLQGIESGRYVVLFTTQVNGQDYAADEWAADSTILGTDIFQELEAQGARQVRALETNQTPYIFIFQKDNPDFLPIERHAFSPTDIIEGSVDLKGTNSIGFAKSPLIGPSKSWKRVEWKTSDMDRSDKVSINIYGVTAEGVEALLYENVSTNGFRLSRVDPVSYPYLKLEMVFEDEVKGGLPTPPKLDYWRVYHDPIFDLALAPNLQFAFQDTLEQGQALALELGILNMSDVASDSLLMQYTIIDAKNNEHTHIQREAPLQNRDSLVAKFSFDTKGLQGAHQLIMQTSSIDERREAFQFNNIGIKEFFVRGDVRNPLLDVTFDGVRIMNGDIVSPKPEIMIYLRDENKFLALNDTALMEVKVLHPSGELERFHFNDPNITFYPPTEVERRNEAKLSLRPEFLENGSYQLQVKAEDKTGNDAGDYTYTVDFDVIRENRVSNVLNYPNPFSTSTQFVFTLTGQELPEDLKIQIMTVAGQVIREIDMAELGPLRIGQNISEFRWDGTDQFGDKLANGVYLYRVMIRSADGVKYEKFDTQTDQYFMNNIGKMVLLR